MVVTGSPMQGKEMAANIALTKVEEKNKEVLWTAPVSTVIHNWLACLATRRSVRGTRSVKLRVEPREMCLASAAYSSLQRQFLFRFCTIQPVSCYDITDMDRKPISMTLHKLRTTCN